MATCPNINLPQWKELVASRGENMAYFLWDTYNGEVPQSESKQAILRASIKSIDILSSQKAKQVFAKGENNNWTLDKTLTELQVPKAQKEIILDKGITNREEIITSLLAENSFIVEVNTATENKATTLDLKYVNNPGVTGYDHTVLDDFGGIKKFNSKEEALQYIENNKKVKNTKHYSNLTVPGGTNYTENEITTPDITPNIKGHAQFSTDNGIGWFRSDEQTLLEENIILDEEDPFLDQGDRNPRTIKSPTGRTNTRRILEVQSDLFQKGRGKDNLLDKGEAFGKSYGGSIPSGELLDKIREVANEAYNKPTVKEGTIVTVDDNNYEKANGMWFKQKIKPTDSKNQFLQILNKDNNWVTFFVKSIIQDSAKKGYERVLFPKGDTAAKIEGLETIAEEITRNDKIIESFKYAKVEKSDNRYYWEITKEGFESSSKYMKNREEVLKDIEKRF